MNRKEYLSKLKRALKKAGLQDYTEVITEYSEHFDTKSAKGYGEEEIAARLPSPGEVAAQFEVSDPSAEAVKWDKLNKALRVTGLVCVHILTWPVIVLLFALVVSLAVLTVASALGGTVCVVTGRSLSLGAVPVVFVPEMPYVSAVFFGVALLALGVLSVIGMGCCRVGAVKLFKVLMRWHERVLEKCDVSQPSFGHPLFTPGKQRFIRVIVLSVLVVFIFALIAAFATMVIISGSLEPWHVWGWFD